MGNITVDGERINGSDSVRLELNSTIPADNGTWTCIITVNGVNVTMPGGEIVEEVLIDKVVVFIDLYIVCKSFCITEILHSNHSKSPATRTELIQSLFESPSVSSIIMWQSQVENEHYSTVKFYNYVAVTGNIIPL